VYSVVVCWTAATMSVLVVVAALGEMVCPVVVGNVSLMSDVVKHVITAINRNFHLHAEMHIDTKIVDFRRFQDMHAALTAVIILFSKGGRSIATSG